MATDTMQSWPDSGLESPSARDPGRGAQAVRRQPSPGPAMDADRFLIGEWCSVCRTRTEGHAQELGLPPAAARWLIIPLSPLCERITPST